MILGFSGTDKGMTPKQRTTVRYLFNELQLHILHHGDCVGADAQAHALARYLRARIEVHPPIDEKARAFCKGFDRIHPPAPYLIRNGRIAREGIHGLIAAPAEFAEVLRSGTWSTVRYARTMERSIWIVFPNGLIREEPR